MKKMSSKLAIRFVSPRRYFSLKHVVIPDETVIQNVDNNVFKPRKHPGVMQPKNVAVPDAFIKAVLNVCEDYPVKSILEDGEKFCRHLHSRMAPIEQDTLQETVRNLYNKVIAKHSKMEIKSEKEAEKFQQMIKDKTNYLTRKKVYNWQPIKYDAYTSMLYLFGRSAAEYGVLTKIFGEINARDTNLKPRSLFDFGSGTGTAMWAANTFWEKDIFEFYNVDISRDMNDLSEILLQGGRSSSMKIPKGVFYRQFMPAEKVTYDIVVSAYSMLELPNLQSRLQTVLNLWNKSEKYLVIVEQGTNAGFKVVNELRDFILQIKKDRNVGHVFSPCPHDTTCPRFLLDDGTPCNFEVKYSTLPIKGPSQTCRELYSYVVLKKGERTEEDLHWPRLVRPTLVRSKHSICRMCTSSGNLTEVIFTASKHGKTLYHCARGSDWGDLLPLKLKEPAKEAHNCDTEKEK